ncbi:molybdate transport system substrate-binding protein [Glaciihabitans tibetensis]|uniref:Molybdate transport system substrate-binding protein n=1 Tax=Glaciihabitans tibetensis TaxID=1266600 RepID=A0A2T0VAR8_9MICO|nr:molybdate ABC transporter substrate-binding protein [Glaciihabitans tibetensis]PRY67251.1 molybdate transport system substrate-binding protein [Glaciihabitans tibetensis]
MGSARRSRLGLGNPRGVARVAVAAALVAAGVSVALSGCAGGSRVSGSITVFAAASLTSTFTELATEFEAANPDTSVVLNFAGSSDLVTQITEGAPADVFASADTRNMAKLGDAGLLSGDAVNFASNTLTIAVPPGNPAGIKDFADLAAPGLKTVVCAPQLPCGAATVAIETATGVTLKPVSEESSVTDVLGKVSSGEADAGLVYVTDVEAAGESVTGISFDEAGAAVNTYPIAAVDGAGNGAGNGSGNGELAAAFIDFVTGPVGQRVLADAGFGAP